MPYLLACTFTVAVFFILQSVSIQPELADMAGGRSLKLLLSATVYIAAFFSVIFIFYTNSFLMKQRKKEFGLYNILGMEKRHIMKVMLFETLYTAVISILLGMLIGIVFSKLVYLLLLKILSLKIEIAFHISLSTVLVTLVLFAGIFLLNLLNNARHIRISSPVELLKSGQVGEKEPKTKVGLTVIGVLALVVGYFLALKIEEPLKAVPLFVVAVILVMIGTYALFASGSITLLKALRKNKRYYYKPNHFISVSGMIYRMKQNAAGLANICILSTAVLVILSSVGSLYIGMSDNIRRAYPYSLTITSLNCSDAKETEINRAIAETASQYGVSANEKLEFRTFYVSFTKEQSSFIRGNGNRLPNDVMCYFVPLEDYNRLNGTNETLAKDQVLIYTTGKAYQYPKLSVDDRAFNYTENFEVKEALKNWPVQTSSVESVYYDSYFIVVNSTDTILEMARAMEPDLNTEHLAVRMEVNFSGERKAVGEVCSSLIDKLSVNDELNGVFVNSADNSKQMFISVCSGILFCGIFLGLLFIMATVLIMYYKQISEGFDDAERYHIMKQVGLSNEEVKKSIRSQILIVFFLPLIAAAIHMAFSFKALTRIMALVGLTNTLLFALCTIGMILIFGVFYTIVYILTSRSYYRIVS